MILKNNSQNHLIFHGTSNLNPHSLKKVIKMKIFLNTKENSSNSLTIKIWKIKDKCLKKSSYSLKWVKIMANWFPRLLPRSAKLNILIRLNISTAPLGNKKIR